MNEIVTVKDLHDYFGYRVIVGNETSFRRRIMEPDISRPGFELMGYYERTDRKRIYIMGDKEMSFIATMSHERQNEAFEFLTQEPTPMILLARDHPCPEILKDIAQKNNCAILQSYAPTSSVAMEVISFLEERLAVSRNVHGELMQIYGKGVLIRAESGMGKSEIALELLKKGHILVADDRVEVARIHNHIVGECPELLRDYLEVRGVGIINVTQMFGIACTLPSTNVDLVIDLVRWDPEKYSRTVSGENEVEDFFGVSVHKVTLPVSEGRSMAPVIESAVTNHILLQRGINSPAEFDRRVMEYMLKQKEMKG